MLVTNRATRPSRFAQLRKHDCNNCTRLARQQADARERQRSVKSRSLPVFSRDAKADVTPNFRREHELLQEAGAPAGWPELRPGLNVLLLRDPGMVVEVLSDGNRFPCNLPGKPMPVLTGASLANVGDPAEHRRRRDALQPHFNTSRVRALVPHLTKTAQAAAATLLAVSRQAGACDVEDVFRRLMLDTFGRTDLGYEFHAVEDLAKPHDQRHLYGGLEFLQVWDNVLELAVRAGLRAEEPMLATLRGILRGQIHAVRQQLQSEGSSDPEARTNLVALLLQQQASGKYPHLTDAVIEDELMALMVGGFDTTASTLSWTLHHLLSHPPALAATLAEVDTVAAGRPLAELKFEDYRRMEYLMACVTETTRLNMPAGASFRYAAVDTTLGGGAVELPRGTALLPSLYAPQHHEAMYECAEEWLPERWLPDGLQELKPKRKDVLLPFGLGARVCIGRQYALLVLPVMLAQLLGTVRLAPAPHAPPVRLGPSLLPRTAQGIWVTAEPNAV